MFNLTKRKSSEESTPKLFPEKTKSKNQPPQKQRSLNQNQSEELKMPVFDEVELSVEEKLNVTFDSLFQEFSSHFGFLKVNSQNRTISKGPDSNSSGQVADFESKFIEMADVQRFSRANSSLEFVEMQKTSFLLAKSSISFENEKEKNKEHKIDYKIENEQKEEIVKKEAKKIQFKNPFLKKTIQISKIELSRTRLTFEENKEAIDCSFLYKNGKFQKKEIYALHEVWVFRRYGGAFCWRDDGSIIKPTGDLFENIVYKKKEEIKFINNAADFRNHSKVILHYFLKNFDKITKNMFNYFLELLHNFSGRNIKISYDQKIMKCFFNNNSEDLHIPEKVNKIESLVDLKQNSDLLKLSMFLFTKVSNFHENWFLDFSETSEITSIIDKHLQIEKFDSLLFTYLKFCLKTKNWSRINELAKKRPTVILLCLQIFNDFWNEFTNTFFREMLFKLITFQVHFSKAFVLLLLDPELITHKEVFSLLLKLAIEKSSIFALFYFFQNLKFGKDYFEIDKFEEPYLLFLEFNFFKLYDQVFLQDLSNELARYSQFSDKINSNKSVSNISLTKLNDWTQMLLKQNHFEFSVAKKIKILPNFKDLQKERSLSGIVLAKEQNNQSRSNFEKEKTNTKIVGFDDSQIFPDVDATFKFFLEMNRDENEREIKTIRKK